MIGFNLWHLANRSAWDGSPIEALTLGPAIRDFAARHDPAVRVDRPYDGQFYYAIAYDPALRSHEVVPLLDDPAYRYRRILLPALGNLLALGRPTLFPRTLLLINAGAWLACGALAWQLAKRERLPAIWATIGVLGTTGLVYSAFRTLPEPLALALLLAGVLASRSDRPLLAATLLGLAPLAREDAILPAATILLFETLRLRPTTSRLLTRAAVVFLPFLLWSLFLFLRLPPSPLSMLDRIGWPFQALVTESIQAFELNEARTNLVRTLSANAVVAWLGLEALFALRRTPTLWGALALGQAAICLLIRGDVWTYWAGSIRLLAPLSVFSLFAFLEGKERRIGRADPASTLPQG